jgi:hypothetical protein
MTFHADLKSQVIALKKSVKSIGSSRAFQKSFGGQGKWVSRPDIPLTQRELDALFNDVDSEAFDLQEKRPRLECLPLLQLEK